VLDVRWQAAGIRDIMIESGCETTGTTEII